MTPQRLAAYRRSAARSRGPVTPQGRRHSYQANLRHGFYSQRWRDSMLALGENPWDFDRFLDSLIDTWLPANGFEMALVHRLARTLWRMERGDRIQESLAAKHGAKPEELVTDPTARTETAPAWVDKAREIGKQEAGTVPPIYVKPEQEPEPSDLDVTGKWLSRSPVST
jgi:hypothetical protein